LGIFFNVLLKWKAREHRKEDKEEKFAESGFKNHDNHPRR